MPKSYCELLNLDNNDKENIKNILLLANVPNKTCPHALNILRLCSFGQIFKYCAQFPKIKELCQLPAMRNLWLNWLRLQGDFAKLEFTTEQLLAQAHGYFLFHKYCNYIKKKSENDLAAKELLDKACQYSVFPALRQRCILARYELKRANVDLAQLSTYMEYANAMHSFLAPGYLEAAMVYIEIGFYLQDKPNDFFTITSRMAYRQALYLLCLADETSENPLTNIYIYIAYGEAGIQWALPNGLMFTDWHDLKFRLCQRYSLNVEDLNWAKQHAQLSNKQVTKTQSEVTHTVTKNSSTVSSVYA